MFIDEEMESLYIDFQNAGFVNSRLCNSHLVQPIGVREQLPFVKLKLTNTQVNIIGILGAYGETTLGKLAKTQACAKNLISAPVNKLVELNLVERYHKPDDYRYVYVKLTDYGAKLHKEQLEIISKHLMEKFYSVATKEEIKSLTGFYNQFNEILSRFEKE